MHFKMTRSFSTALLLSVLVSVQWDSANTSCVSNLKDRKSALNIIANRNQSGHLITKFTADDLSVKLSSKIQVDVSSELICQDDRKGIRIEGVLTAPPSPPENYKFFPGIGYYKNHDNLLNFDAAIKACENEGGHLAVVDSKEEGEALATLGIKQQSYIGAHDQVTEGKFMTIFGNPMANHIAWGTNQPDDGGGKEDCVTILSNGKLNDVPCDYQTSFICEFDLTWSN